MTSEHHQTDDGLRARLAAIDPARGASIDPMPHNLMEHVMTITTSTPTPAGDLPAPRRPRRWKVPAALGGVAAAAAAVIGVAALRDDDGTVTADPLELNGGSDVLASCLPFTVEILAQMPTAFEGTVVAVDGATVTFDIDRWYHDGTGSAAQEAVIHAPQGMEALIDGVAFEAGGQYLVSADADGNVSYCGYSAVATDDLRAAFAEAFPG